LKQAQKWVLGARSVKKSAKTGKHTPKKHQLANFVKLEYPRGYNYQRRSIGISPWKPHTGDIPYLFPGISSQGIFANTVKL